MKWFVVESAYVVSKVHAARARLLRVGGGGMQVQENYQIIQGGNMSGPAALPASVGVVLAM
jgi:hypothetical protein